MATIQDVFSHIYTTEAHLGDVPVKNGQIILCTDSEKLYIDHGTTRVSTSDVVQVDNQEALPLAPLDKLYITKDTGDIFFYINGAWEKINQSDISVGAGLSGNGSSSSPLQLDIKNYSSTDNINLTSSNQVNVTGTNSISLLSNDNQSSIEISATGIVLNSYVGVTINSQGNALSFATGTNPSGERDIYLDNHSMNTAGGFAVVDLTTGKLPIGIIPDVTGNINIDNYTSNSTIRLTSTAGAVNLISNTGEVGLYSGSNVYVKVLTDTVELKATTVSLNGHAQNTSGGFVVVDTDTGKIPDSLLPSGDLDLSNYSTSDNIKLSAGTLMTLSGLGCNINATGSTGLQLGTTTSNTTVGSESGRVAIQANGLNNLVLITPDKLEGAVANTAHGFAIVGANGKLPTSIIPASTIDLSAYTGGINLTGTTDTDVVVKYINSDEMYNGTVTLNKDGFDVSAYSITMAASTASISGNLSAQLTSSGTTTIGGSTINLSGMVLQYNGHDTNTASGLVQLDTSGKVPESLLPEIGNASWTKVILNQADFATEDTTYGGSYKELNGICSVEVYDANGYKVEFDVKCDFTNNKTRIYIPSGLTAATISNWTLLYLAKSIA